MAVGSASGSIGGIIAERSPKKQGGMQSLLSGATTRQKEPLEDDLGESDVDSSALVATARKAKTDAAVEQLAPAEDAPTPALDVQTAHAAARTMGKGLVGEGDKLIDGGGGYTFIDRGEDGYQVVDAPLAAYAEGRKPIGASIRPGTEMYAQVQKNLGMVAPEAVGEKGAVPKVDAEEAPGESLQEPPAVASSFLQAEELAQVSEDKANAIASKTDEERYADYQAAVRGKSDYLNTTLEEFDGIAAKRAQRAKYMASLAAVPFVEDNFVLQRFGRGVADILAGKAAAPVQASVGERYAQKDPRAQAMVRHEVQLIKNKVFGYEKGKKGDARYRNMALAGWPYQVTPEEWWATTEAKLSAHYGFDVGSE
tara:strand:+ start:427 stop:1530 length:1104 start_codon:yes stop_codon:yes gene_type:complete